MCICTSIFAQKSLRKLYYFSMFSLVLLAACSPKPKEAAPKPANPSEATNTGNSVTIPENSPMLSQIRSVAVAMADVPTDEVDAPGKIEADPNRVSHVAMPLSGRIATVSVRLGDTVERGQTLLTLESPDADVAAGTYLQTESGINSAKSAVLKAQADYDRAKDLFQNSAVAQKDVLTAESTLAQTKATLETANLMKEQAGRRLDLLGLKRDQFGQKIQVKAPISGKVLELTVAANEYRNDTNASLMTIGDLSRVWVSSDVPETYIRFVQIGEPVDLELQAYPGKIFRAKVKRIADTVDPVTRTIKVNAELANQGGQLRPEMFGRIRHVESMHKMPVVPLSAIMQGDGQNYVFRQTGKGTFEKVSVELGSRLPDRVSIVKGLQAGDMVVVDGVMLLKAA